MNQALTAQQLRELLQCARCGRYFSDLVACRVRTGLEPWDTHVSEEDLCEDCADCASFEAGMWIVTDCNLGDGPAVCWYGEDD